MVFPLLNSQRLALTPISYEDRDAIFALGYVEQAQRYLSFIAEKLVNAEAKVIEYIDVYYVETLLWGASSHTIAVGWPLVPANLQKLYINFHGKAPQN
ncbi:MULTISPECIES: DUF7674 family protein [unclassified Pseudoalteromonas]|uniref:DUF7674 family protein n=1 Tax=unclassified Pseudoalteromonas TaxID=194690 RepID=UPI0004114C93|nr:MULTISPECIES: hypothetical protein [unclassified Pseudoalteromonas]MDC9499151.1 hypothetical protein [Pseudoalteromonas sp. Angola-20]MDC9518806.1 hypothetical protein [Pseudoalteromonas sp. Angola-22]MDC9535220.1 hypothetical protein [Pseudoalteromonas sp. Angola-9]TMP78604.1 hypothetical protein CWB71_17815 [Pseudoalteromonas sp. S983]